MAKRPKTAGLIVRVLSACSMAAMLFLMGGELAVAILSVPLIAGLRIVLHVGAWLVLLMVGSVPVQPVLDGWETETASVIVLAMGCGYAVLKRPNPFWNWNIGTWPDALRSRLRLLGGFAVLAAAFLAAGMLFDGSQLALQTVLVIGYLVLSQMLIRQAPKAEIDRRKAFVNAGVAVSSVIVCGILFEAAARMFIQAPVPIVSSDHIMTSHPTRLWINAPGVSGEADYRTGPDEWSKFTFTTNEYGLRGPAVLDKQPDELRVLMVGDSFTFGWGVDEGRDFPSRLRDQLAHTTPDRPVSVLNSGVSGYCPWQERDFLEEKGPAFDPDVVLLQLFLGNDLQDTLTRHGQHLEAYVPAAMEREVFWRNHGTWRMQSERWLRRNVHVYHVYRTSRPNWLGVPHIVGWLRFVDALPGLDFAPPANRPPQFEALLTYRYPNLDRAWREVEEEVVGMAEWCRGRGVRFGVFVVPIWTRPAEDIKVREVPLRQDPRGLRYDHDLDATSVESICQTHGIAYIDIRTALIETEREVRTFHTHDGHFSVKGNEVTASVLFDWLTQTPEFRQRTE